MFPDSRGEGRDGGGGGRVRADAVVAAVGGGEEERDGGGAEEEGGVRGVPRGEVGPGGERRAQTISSPTASEREEEIPSHPGCAS